MELQNTPSGIVGGLSIEEYLDQDEKQDLLRLLTAGSVDDGKSTLIGRLLFDSKKLYEDQLSALERDSKRMGNAGAGERCDALRAHEEIEQEAQTDKGENAREKKTHAGLWCFESFHCYSGFLARVPRSRTAGNGG